MKLMDDKVMMETRATERVLSGMISPESGLETMNLIPTHPTTPTKVLAAGAVKMTRNTETSVTLAIAPVMKDKLPHLMLTTVAHPRGSQLSRRDRIRILPPPTSLTLTQAVAQVMREQARTGQGIRVLDLRTPNN
jgi:hypothetical protein